MSQLETGLVSPPTASSSARRRRPGRAARAPAPSTTLRVAYCEAGNYRRVAERLLGACRAEHPEARIVGELEPARGGVFEVYVGGQLVHSKRATSRLPEDVEIFYHVRAALPNR